MRLVKIIGQKTAAFKNRLVLGYGWRVVFWAKINAKVTSTSPSSKVRKMNSGKLQFKNWLTVRMIVITNTVRIVFVPIISDSTIDNPIKRTGTADCQK
jgi:hypothetical protein